MVLAVVAALSFVTLLVITGDDAPAEDVTTLTQEEVADSLLRSGPATGDVELEFLYAPSWYFTWSGREVPDTGGEPALVFYMFETIHEGELAPTLPEPVLWWGGGPVFTSSVSEVSVAPHHRVTQIIYPIDASKEEASSEFILRVSEPLAPDTAFAWSLPMANGLGVIGGGDEAAHLRSPSISAGALLVIFGGMLTALSPCLLLLATYYTAVLSGAAAAADRSRVETRVISTGMFFIGGFAVVYTLGGVIAGFVGESVGRLENVSQWARPLSIVAGIAVVVLGIRVAAQARVPVVCKIPAFGQPARSGKLGSVLMGSTFAVGCLSCFSATVLTAMLGYAGATGSPAAGGLIMLMFSAGVGLMFLLAATLVGRAVPVSEWLTRAQPIIGAASAIIMVTLGVLMITYQFHIVTGYVFKLMS
jgi:cytochrome c-type biogenesis protein